MSDPTVEYLTVSEVAEILRMPERSVLRLLKSGSLPGAYGGTRAGWRVRRADVETWTTNRPVDASMLSPEALEYLKKLEQQQQQQQKLEQQKRKKPAKRPAKKPEPTED